MVSCHNGLDCSSQANVIWELHTLKKCIAAVCTVRHYVSPMLVVNVELNDRLLERPHRLTVGQPIGLQIRNYEHFYESPELRSHR